MSVESRRDGVLPANAVMSRSSVPEFLELLNAEQFVDLPKVSEQERAFHAADSLRGGDEKLTRLGPSFSSFLPLPSPPFSAQVKEFSRHGIPDEIRGEVWMYLLGVLSPDKSESFTISSLVEETKLTFSLLLPPLSASELTTARSRLQTYSSLPKSNDLVSRLATSAARKYHLRTFGTRSIEQMVQDATVDPPPLPPSFRPDILAGVGGPGDISRNGSAQASPLLGGERSFPTNPNSILPPPSSPTLFPISSSSTPPTLLQDDEPSPTPSIEPSSPSFLPPLSPLPQPSQPQRVFSQFSTNLTNSSASPSIFPSPYPSTAPPPIHTFTRSIIDVLGSWANQHPGCLDGLDWERREIIEGWVSTVGPFVGCLKLEAGVYWGWGEWRGKMGESLLSLFRSDRVGANEGQLASKEEIPVSQLNSRAFLSISVSKTRTSPRTLSQTG